MIDNLSIAVNKQIELEHITTGLSRKILSYSNKMMVVEVHFEKDAVGDIHAHEHEQIAYVVSGKFEFNIEGKSIIVTPGDSIHFSPNQSHGTKCLEAGILLDTFTPCRLDFIVAH